MGIGEVVITIVFMIIVGLALLVFIVAKYDYMKFEEENKILKEKLKNKKNIKKEGK